MSSYYSVINWIDACFRATENHDAGAADAADDSVSAQPQPLDQGSLDHWKVTWRKEGAKFGKATCGVVGGLIANFSVLPLMITAFAGGIPPAVATPALMSGMAYNAGAWIGGHAGHYVGYGIGALAAETFDVLSKISSKLYQWAKTLFAAAMERFCYVPNNPPPPPNSLSHVLQQPGRDSSSPQASASPVQASAYSENLTESPRASHNLHHRDEDSEEEASNFSSTCTYRSGRTELGAQSYRHTHLCTARQILT